MWAEANTGFEVIDFGAGASFLIDNLSVHFYSKIASLWIARLLYQHWPQYWSQSQHF